MPGNPFSNFFLQAIAAWHSASEDARRRELFAARYVFFCRNTTTYWAELASNFRVNNFGQLYTRGYYGPLFIVHDFADRSYWGCSRRYGRSPSGTVAVARLNRRFFCASKRRRGYRSGSCQPAPGSSSAASREGQPDRRHDSKARSRARSNYGTGIRRRQDENFLRYTHAHLQRWHSG